MDLKTEQKEVSNLRNNKSELKEWRASHCRTIQSGLNSTELDFQNEKKNILKENMAKIHKFG